MSILASLAKAYERIKDVPPFGYSAEKIGFVISLSNDGAAVSVTDLRSEDKKKSPRVMQVPQPVKRTVGIAPNFLWDKTSYVLGVTAERFDGLDEKKRKRMIDRLADEHAVFVRRHLDALSDSDDAGLNALRRFLQSWRPEQFAGPLWPADMKDQNVVFALESDRRSDIYLHDRPAAKVLWEKQNVSGESANAVCLITGEEAPVARLHPAIKGVWGAQTSGASIVAFNQDSFTSYGHEQGDNAPVSEAAVFRYTTALNAFLAKGSRNRIQIGDASTVFWADASNAATAQEAEAVFAGMIDDLADVVAKFEEVNEEIEARKVGAILKHIRKGQPLKEISPELSHGVRFHVLGLAPNAARLSVRYWLTDDFGQFARRLAEHHADLRMYPAPMGWGAAPSVNLLLARTTAFKEKFENIPSPLAGEVMRAVLSGTRYPQSLLAAAIIRLRAGDPKSSDGKSLPIGWHAAVIRAVLFRDQRLRRKNPDIPGRGETPMSLKRDHDNPGYQLGRLFAVYELVQRSALGKVNATIRDRYFGAASATPASVFPLIVRGGQPHLAKVRKEKPGWAVLIERELEEINGRFTPKADAEAIWPRSLRLKDQGEFAIGYYHQRAAKLSNDKGEQVGFDDAAENTAEGKEE